jgi:hypothetical protein
MNTRVLSLLAMVLLAFVLRWLLPADNGFTVYFTRRTTFVPLNLLAFWVTMGVALVAGAILLLPQRRV